MVAEILLGVVVPRTTASFTVVVVVVRLGTHAVVVVDVSAVVLVVVVDADAVVNTMPVWGGRVACCTVRPSRST